MFTATEKIRIFVQKLLERGFENEKVVFVENKKPLKDVFGEKRIKRKLKVFRLPRKDSF